MKLRTDYFETKEREETRYIAVRDTLTKPSVAEGMTVFDIDADHCRRGRLGIGYHALVLCDGTWVMGRGWDTIGAHSRNLDTISVAIGVVGGVDEEGKRMNTRTPEQMETIVNLIERMQIMYPDAEVHDNPN